MSTNALTWSDYEPATPTISLGDLVTGTVVMVDRDRNRWLDIGPAKSEVLVPDATAEVGDEIKAIVLDVEDDEGRIIGSVKRVAQREAFLEAERARAELEPIRVEVTEILHNGSGYLARFGPLKAFIPKRYVSNPPVVGDIIEAVVLQMRPDNLVVSPQVDLEREYRRLEVGQLHSAKVDRLTYSRSRKTGKQRASAVIAKLDSGITGYVHISQLDDLRIWSLEDFISPGERMLVRVTKLNDDERLVWFSRKAALGDAWLRFSASLFGSNGQNVVQGRITRERPSGLIVRLSSFGVDGFVHDSRLNGERPKVGEIVQVRVLGVSTKDRRASLALA